MQVNNISASSVIPIVEPAQKDSAQSFGQLLLEQIEKVNESQLKTGEVTKQFLSGNIQDIHQVLIAAQESKITLELAVEIRNKVIEAYQEVSRMSV
ncbi:MAG TPA: flagellar hook-basal body complex protein FliE [Desulfotomaculum sp.]|nr:MAG: Flagellar hook-basal body complex protein FliE [Desulfotomaculum sp. 46_80]HAG11544.1 flagellar hook-basal body complex protein FliE [Desulfotomaculum sp.]HBY03752.1 flagellar hook-basal body complex protein FliE [Desulfotomaculum sp.]